MLPTATPLSSIPARLKLYEKCRYERASTIQEYSRSTGKDLGSGPPVDIMHFIDYNFGHDEWHYSTQMLRKWEWENKNHLLSSMPTAFGPMPEPRQDFHGRTRDSSKATFKTASVKFKTSRTLLQNLLPEGLEFASADTIAYATFAATQLNDLEWLGGRGYSHFGLYMHGIKHIKANGETVTGTYVPVLFENCADSILSDREELGLPKFFAELNVKQDDKKWALDAGWMSSKFCTMTLSGLEEHAVTNGVTPAPFPSLPKDEGLLFHKYNASGKQQGPADVEYTAFLPGTENAKTVDRKVERKLKTNSASISFDALDWKALPTLHHVVKRLEEIPVYEVYEAKVEEGTGVNDLSSVQRLE
jgi:hypothetical protein